MKTLRNQAFSPLLGPVGRSVAPKTGSRVKNTNKIKGFEHFSYGMALFRFDCFIVLSVLARVGGAWVLAEGRFDF